MRFLLFVFCLRLHALDFEYEGFIPEGEKCLFVSLGAFCEISLRLRDCGLRHAAFPFDWLITKRHESLIEMLDEDFAHFLDLAYFSQLENVPTRLTNSYYEIYFIHDWPFPGQSVTPALYDAQLAKISEKYGRRIARFRSLRDFPGKIFFFRTSWFEETKIVTKKQAAELREALDRYFPENDFLLVIVNYTDVGVPLIEDLEGVREYKIRRAHNSEDFRGMFHHLISES